MHIFMSVCVSLVLEITDLRYIFYLYNNNT